MEKSGNWIVVREKSGKMEKVRDKSGKVIITILQLHERKINLLSRDKIGVGIGAVSEVSKAKCSNVQKMEFRMHHTVSKIYHCTDWVNN